MPSDRPLAFSPGTHCWGSLDADNGMAAAGKGFIRSSLRQSHEDADILKDKDETGLSGLGNLIAESDLSLFDNVNVPM